MLCYCLGQLFGMPAHTAFENDFIFKGHGSKGVSFDFLMRLGGL